MWQEKRRVNIVKSSMDKNEKTERYIFNRVCKFVMKYGSVCFQGT